MNEEEARKRVAEIAREIEKKFVEIGDISDEHNIDVYVYLPNGASLTKEPWNSSECYGDTDRQNWQYSNC